MAFGVFVEEKQGPDSGFAGVEASLDIQYIMSVGQDVKTYFWSTPGLSPCCAFC